MMSVTCRQVYQCIVEDDTLREDTYTMVRNAIDRKHLIIVRQCWDVTDEGPEEIARDIGQTSRLQSAGHAIIAWADEGNDSTLLIIAYKPDVCGFTIME